MYQKHPWITCYQYSCKRGSDFWGSVLDVSKSIMHRSDIVNGLELGKGNITTTTFTVPCTFYTICGRHISSLSGVNDNDDGHSPPHQ
jgi:hypothetical protein